LRFQNFNNPKNKPLRCRAPPLQDFRRKKPHYAAICKYLMIARAWSIALGALLLACAVAAALEEAAFDQ
jgi:hypothetical protein